MYRRWAQMACLVSLVTLAFTITLPAWAAEKVVFWTPWGPPNYTWWKTMVDEFNASQSLYEVEVIQGTGDMQTYEKLLVNVAAGTGPDLVHLGFDFAARLVQNNAILPLDDHIKNGSLKLSEYMPGLLDLGKHNNRIYAIPFMGIFRGSYYYDVNVFAEAGLDPDKPPFIWSDVIKTAKRLTRKSPTGAIERAGISYPFSGFNAYISFFQTLQAFGGSMYDYEHNRLTFNSEAGVQALETLISLPNSENVMSFSITADPTPLATGKLAMALNTSGSIGVFSTTAQKTQAQVRFSKPLRSAADSEPGLWAGGHAFMMPWNAKNAKGAWSFIEFMGTHDRALQWAKLSMQAPVQRRVMLEYMRTVDNPFSWGHILEGLEATNGKAQRFELEHPSIPQDVLAPILASAYKGQTSAKAALSQAESLVLAALKDGK